MLRARYTNMTLLKCWQTTSINYYPFRSSRS